jgi:hypothetical protein
MKLPPLQDGIFVNVLPWAIFRGGPNIVLTTDQSDPFHPMKLLHLQDIGFVHLLPIFRRGPCIVLTTDQSVSYHMKLPLLQESGFVRVLSCAIFRTGPCNVLSTDQSVPFHMKLPTLQDMFCPLLFSEEVLVLC